MSDNQFPAVADAVLAAAMNLSENCLVCTSVHFWKLQNGIGGGRMWRNIIQDLPPDAGLTADDLKAHWAAGHGRTDEADVHVALEAASPTVPSTAPSTAARTPADLTLADTIVRQLIRQLAAGEVQPTVRDGLAAAAHLARHADVPDESVFFDAYWTLLDLVNQLTPPDLRDKINEELKVQLKRTQQRQG